MAFLDEVYDILTSAASSEVGDGQTWPIFLGHLPDSTVLDDRAVALINTPGGGDEGGVEIENPGLQVLVRGLPLTENSTAYEAANQLAHDMKNNLHGFTGSPSSSGHHYVGIWNQSGPFFLGYDKEMRPRFSINLNVLRSRT